MKELLENMHGAVHTFHPAPFVKVIGEELFGFFIRIDNRALFIQIQTFKRLLFIACNKQSKKGEKLCRHSIEKLEQEHRIRG